MTPPPMTVLAATSGSAVGMIVENFAPARNQSPPALDTPILMNLTSGFHCPDVWAKTATDPKATRARTSHSDRARVFVMHDHPGPHGSHGVRRDSPQPDGECQGR